MTSFTVEFPETALAALQMSPKDIRAELRLAAAITWYEAGNISQEVAAEIAGLCRIYFLLALARAGRDSFHVDLDELDEELTRE